MGVGRLVEGSPRMRGEAAGGQRCNSLRWAGLGRRECLYGCEFGSSQERVVVGVEEIKGFLYFATGS